MAQKAHSAARVHPHWKAELESLRERMKYQKSIAAIARMMLVNVWHILTKQEADMHTTDERVAKDFLVHAYDLGAKNRQDGITCQEVVREQLDRQGLGKNLEVVKWAESREIRMPLHAVK